MNLDQSWLKLAFFLLENSEENFHIYEQGWVLSTYYNSIGLFRKKRKETGKESKKEKEN